MNTLTPTPAFAAIDMTADLRLAPGVGLALAGLVSIGFWIALAQILVALVG